MKSSNTVPAVDHALRILAFLAETGRASMHAELAARAGTSATTGYRILQTLMAHGWVQKGAGGYKVDTRRLAALFSGNDRMRRIVALQPLLDGLVDGTSLSAKFSIREGGEQVSVLRAMPAADISVAWKVGARFPVVEGTVGAALLSQETPDVVATLCRNAGADIPERRDAGLVAGRIASIRRTGCAVSTGDNRWHVTAMSAPVPDASGAVAGALTLLGLGPAPKPRGLAALRQRLLDCAQECHRILAED